MLQVDVTVVMPPMQDVHGTVTVVSKGVDGIRLVTDGVPLPDGELEDEDEGDGVEAEDEELEVEDEELEDEEVADSGPTAVLSEELVLVVSAGMDKVIRTAVVMGVVEIVVFMLVVTTPLVVIVYSEVIVMVDMVVMVLAVGVFVTGVALDEPWPAATGVEP